MIKNPPANAGDVGDAGLSPGLESQRWNPSLILKSMFFPPCLLPETVQLPGEDKGSWI